MSPPTATILYQYTENDDPVLVVAQCPTRGMGPRALEQFMQKRTGTTNTTDPWKVLNLAYAAYLQNIVLMIRTKRSPSCSSSPIIPDVPDTLVSNISMTVHALVKKNKELPDPPSYEDANAESLVQTTSHPGTYRTRVRVVEVHSGIALVEATSLSFPILPQQFRKHLSQNLHCPVLGKDKLCHPYRGELLCMGTTQLSFSFRQQKHTFSLPIPSKLLKILQKEKERSIEHPTTMEIASNNKSHSGMVDFRGLSIQVNNDIVMTPRTGSETLVVKALEQFEKECSRKRNHHQKKSENQHGNSPIVVLDLGTGSGCLLLSIVKQLLRDSNDSNRSLVCGVGVDISSPALELASQNAQYNGRLLSSSCQWIHASFQNFVSSYREQKVLYTSTTSDGSRQQRQLILPSIIVCNPPYHRKYGRKKQLDDRGEPDHALFVEDSDGDLLIHYRNVLQSLSELLLGHSTTTPPTTGTTTSTPTSTHSNQEGDDEEEESSDDDTLFFTVLCFEVCRENASKVCALLEESHFWKDIRTFRDPRGNIRCVTAIGRR